LFHHNRAFGKINHIVNNAGFTFDGMLHKITEKQWDLMLAVHNTAPWRIVKAASPYLVRELEIFTKDVFEAYI
jgi:3-oxoacyl-[acyl-carrier protein] reductase